VKIALFHNVPSGGAKRTLYEQTKRLATRHDVAIFTISTANHSYCPLRPYVYHEHVVPFSPPHLLRSPFGRINQILRSERLLRLERVQRRLAATINDGDYDVALVHPCMFTFSPTILRGLTVPSLYYRQDPVRWTHDPSPPRPYNRAGRMRRIVDRIDPLRWAYFRLLVHEDRTSMLAATRVVTNSYFMRETLYRLYGVAPAVCYHGVDADTFRPLGLEREPFVLSVGSVSPVKGYDFVIDSLATLPAGIRPRLVIAANSDVPGEPEFLDRHAADRGVSLEIQRLVSDEDLVQLYNRARCTVFAPVMEPFGLVPLESMACGTPVVGIREGGVRETVVDEATGLLADRDAAEFGAQVARLLGDPGLAGRLGRASRAHVQRHWTWERAVDRLERHLVEVASSHRPHIGEPAPSGESM
jgi:glycosyltransferase involved in cell wall biosynthesis